MPRQEIFLENDTIDTAYIARDPIGMPINPLLELYPEFKNPEYALGKCRTCGEIVQNKHLIGYSGIASWLSARNNGSWGFDNLKFRCPNDCASTSTLERILTSRRNFQRLKHLMDYSGPVYKSYIDLNEHSKRDYFE